MTYATVVPGADATTGNASAIPAGLQAAGYTTGSGIAWTAQQWAAHPGAVRIDQDALARDPTADVLDVENGAATPAEVAGWVTRARADFAAGKRPGQREPAVYVNLSNITAVANNLTAAGISGAGLWIAHYGVSQAEAEALLTWGTSMGGPWPVVGFQYSDQGGGGAYDLNVFSGAWLGRVSGPVPQKPPAPKPAPVAPAEVDVTLERLENGSAGQPVQNWQGILVAHALGFMIATGKGNVMQYAGIDGHFGAKTEVATKKFQAEAGLPQTGVVDAATWTKALG